MSSWVDSKYASSTSPVRVISHACQITSSALSNLQINLHNLSTSKEHVHHVFRALATGRALERGNDVVICQSDQTRDHSIMSSPNKNLHFRMTIQLTYFIQIS